MNGRFALTGFIPDKTWGTADIGLTAQLSPQRHQLDRLQRPHFSDNSQRYNSLNIGVKILF
jgi:outer membrane lipase/esterase